MSNPTQLELAIGGHEEVPPDWMPASQIRSFVFDDPVLVWLEFHGRMHGFQPDSSPYEFLDFIGEKGRQFQAKWQKEMAPDAVYVCAAPHEVRSADKVRETFTRIEKGIPIIAQPALWWAAECIYGVPDFLVHTSWLRQKFPELLATTMQETSEKVGSPKGEQEHYVVLDIKFTTGLNETQKAKDLANYAAQLRIYSYILGHLQGYIPQRAFIITRDRISAPLPVEISSMLNSPIDEDLASLRDRFLEIKLNGARYTPWEDDIVASNISHKDDRWRTAKEIIAREKVSGMDPGLVYYIGRGVKQQLCEIGFCNLDSLLGVDPNEVPFERIRGLGPTRARQIRAILQANRSGSAMPPSATAIPPVRQQEYYVDFEFFTNVNVDFERQWATLEGCEMIFMIGIGWENGNEWCFKKFVAVAENQNEERQILEKFVDFLQGRTDGAVTDVASTVLYHWTHAEKSQARAASNRHALPDTHALRHLPWLDLQKIFLDSPCSVPGAWNYGLKEVAKALGALNPEFDLQWPGNLDEGLPAMVMGWKAYEGSDPLRTQEMNTLSRYLEADCMALRNVLKWMRSN